MKETLARLAAKDSAIAVVGLGYVGLPLACLLAKHYRVVGYDINEQRIAELRQGHDRTREVEDSAELKQANLSYSSDATVLKNAAIIIVAVPTPVDDFHVPDLTPVISASRNVGKHMAPGTVVVFESTVYPGLTETICAKHLAETSSLELNKSFFLGYSPERVVPGDKQRTIEKITKIVSGSTPAVLDLLAEVYGSVIKAGIHRAKSIRVAEAAKVIENAQRDLNIAFVNELSLLFDRLGIDTLEVLEAAGTKWNFLNFRPGLVGGHCIGVDPYYLTHLAEHVGFHTQVISAGRRINDTMGEEVARKTISLILNAKHPPKGPLNIGILGITFKENVPDIRNSKVQSLATALEAFGARVHVVDPLADQDEVTHEYQRKLISWDELPRCDAIVLAVTHDVFVKDLPLEQLLAKCNDNKIVVDLKGCLDRDRAQALDAKIWRL